jgi:hypothetical protein
MNKDKVKNSNPNNKKLQTKTSNKSNLRKKSFPTTNKKENNPKEAAKYLQLNQNKKIKILSGLKNMLIKNMTRHILSCRREILSDRINRCIIFMEEEQIGFFCSLITL